MSHTLISDDEERLDTNVSHVGQNDDDDHVPDGHRVSHVVSHKTSTRTLNWVNTAERFESLVCKVSYVLTPGCDSHGRWFGHKYSMTRIRGRRRGDVLRGLGLLAMQVYRAKRCAIFAHSVTKFNSKRRIICTREASHQEANGPFVSTNMREASC